MISDSHVWAIQILSLCFWYMPPFPIRWSSDFTSTRENKPYWKWIPWVVNFFGIFITGVACFSVVLLNYYWLEKPRKDFHVINAVFLVLRGVIAMIVCHIAYTSIINRVDANMGFNGALELERKLRKGTCILYKNFFEKNETIFFM